MSAAAAVLQFDMCLASYCVRQRLLCHTYMSCMVSVLTQPPCCAVRAAAARSDQRCMCERCQACYCLKMLCNPHKPCQLYCVARSMAANSCNCTSTVTPNFMHSSQFEGPFENINNCRKCNAVNLLGLHQVCLTCDCGLSEPHSSCCSRQGTKP